MTDLRNRKEERAIASGDTDAMYRRLAYLLRHKGSQGWPETWAEKREVERLRKALGLCERCGFSVDEREMKDIQALCETCRMDVMLGHGFYGMVGHACRLTDEVHWRHGGTMSKHWR